MAKLTKDIFGVVAGDIYPTTIEAGEECPPELEEAAREAGALEEVTPEEVTPAVKNAKGL